MAIAVDPSLLREIKRHGAFDISRCFHCGNCSAVCPLSDDVGNFPRRLIRLGQIGAKDRLLDSPETWLCYYCGECSDTCPREAEPGEYMAAVRRYAIAAAEPTGLARWMYRSVLGLIITTALLGAVLGALLVGLKGSAEVKHVLFGLVPYGTVHNVGVGVGLVTMLSLLVGAVRVLKRFLKGTGRRPVASYVAAARSTLAEMATMKRHRSEAPIAGEPWYRNAATVHLAVLWGFVGLLAATVLDYVFIVLLPLGITTFWPARIIGTISGLVMLAGVTAAIVRRCWKTERNVARTDPMDWWLLWVLWILGVTGFWLEIAVTLHASNMINDLVLLVHAALAMELVLLTAFTKLAHVIYRPIALFAYYVRKEPAK